jgi:peptide/nickel transport system substrate-binding protein
MRTLLRTRWSRSALALPVVAAVVVAVLATTALGAGTAGGGTIVYRLTGDWTDFDIQRTSIASQNRISKLVYEGMLAYAPDKDGKTRIVGALAESWTVTPTSITFKLRKGPKCADGTLVTPALVLRSWRRMLEVSTTLPLAFGGSQGGDGKPPTGVGPFSISGSNRTGTVTFRATKPNNELIYGFLGPYGGLPGGTARIVCPAGLNNPERMKTEMFGTGPYQVVEASHLDKAVLKLRRDYTWGPNGIKASTRGLPDTIVYKVVPNDTTAANLFLTGELDVGEVAAPERPRLIASRKFWLGYERSKITTTYLAFNTRRPLLADISLRTALTMVVSPKTYDIAVNGQNSGNVINATFVTPAGDCHDPDATKLLPQGTVAEARALLGRRGYTYRGDDLYSPSGQKVTFEFLGSP